MVSRSKKLKSRIRRKLTELDVRSLGGGVGKGPPAYFYDPEQLWDAAVAKHGGVDAFEKMRAARAKRADMKRARMGETETSAEAQPKKSKGVAEHNTSPVRWRESGQPRLWR